MAVRHDLALAQILKKRPEFMPSIHRLDEKRLAIGCFTLFHSNLARYKSLIIDCLSVDFDFSQFLLGENTSANLLDVKERLKPHGQEGHSFFLFRIFAQMCGKSGHLTQSGSLFMSGSYYELFSSSSLRNESQFRRCTPGLKALQLLWSSEGSDCYADFMLLRGALRPKGQRAFRQAPRRCRASRLRSIRPCQGTFQIVLACFHIL